MPVTLSPEQCQVLDAAGVELDAARKAVGMAYLRHETAAAAASVAAEELEKQARRARRAEVAHANMMVGLAQVLQLPPGKYAYDSAGAQLVRKDDRDE